MGRNVWQVGYLQAEARRLPGARNYSDNQLAYWVNGQRIVKNTGKLRTRTRAAAQRSGICLGLTRRQWEEMFGRLVAYKQQHGDCLVPGATATSNYEFGLAGSASYKNNGKTRTHTRQRLNELGFVWDPRGDQWEEMFGRLVAYKQ